MGVADLSEAAENSLVVQKGNSCSTKGNSELQSLKTYVPCTTSEIRKNASPPKLPKKSSLALVSPLTCQAHEGGGGGAIGAIHRSPQSAQSLPTSQI